MTVRLADLAACFDGVIPSLVATADAAGRPNVSYLSQVVYVDEAHVALSNQFFAKTARNLRENPRASVLLVDGRTGSQYSLAVRWVETLVEGPLFDRIAAHLEAGRSEGGASAAMRLRGVDVHRVEAITPVPHETEPVEAPAPAHPSLGALAGVVSDIASRGDLEAIVEALLAGVETLLGLEHVLLLLADETRGVLTTVASRGHAPSGIGSEVRLGDGPIGVAAASATVVRINDLSRVRRFRAAAGGEDENRTRTIAVPGLAGALSRIAVPIVGAEGVRGVLFAESPHRLAFDHETEAALVILTRQAAAGLAAAVPADIDDAAVAPVPVAPGGPISRIAHYAYDDSVFVDDVYIVKGLSGRLLVHMLELHLREGRCDFTNRELRLAEALRLPEFKDNLETRLLLLRRRLEEKATSIGLRRVDRGRMRLEISGRPQLIRS